MGTTGGDSNWALLCMLYCRDLKGPSQSVALSSLKGDKSIAESFSLRVLVSSAFGASNFNETALRHEGKVQDNNFILTTQRQPLSHNDIWEILLPTAGTIKLRQLLCNFDRFIFPQITFQNVLRSSVGGRGQQFVAIEEEEDMCHL